MNAMPTSRARRDIRSHSFPRRVGPEDQFLAAIGEPAASFLREIEASVPGTLAALIENGAEATLIRAGARLIDLSTTTTRGEATREQASPFSPLVEEIIATVDPSYQELTRLSLTAPQGRDSRAGVMTAARELLARVHAEGGVGSGGLLARDRRDVGGDGGHHLYGVVAAERRARPMIRDAWADLTGASRGAVKHNTVGGWPRYAASGDRGSLRRNLSNVIGYAFHDLPRGEQRDLRSDVVSCGSLDAPWRAFMELGDFLPAPRPGTATSHEAIRSPACLTCGGSLARKRAKAKFCSDRCRMKQRDRSKERVSARADNPQRTP